MAKHKPAEAWLLRKPGVWPYGDVQTMIDGGICIRYQFCKNGRADLLTMSRNDARLFARRILQCLEETK